MLVGDSWWGTTTRSDLRAVPAYFFWRALALFSTPHTNVDRCRLLRPTMALVIPLEGVVQVIHAVTLRTTTAVDVAHL